jgi:hypothetical protein
VDVTMQKRMQEILIAKHNANLVSEKITNTMQITGDNDEEKTRELRQLH